MPSSGMLRRVALVRIDVSEERIASMIRVTRIGELGTTLALTSNRRTLRRNTQFVLLSGQLRDCKPSMRPVAVDSGQWLWIQWQTANWQGEQQQPWEPTALPLYPTHIPRDLSYITVTRKGHSFV
jgi:hypothetical protein